MMTYSRAQSEPVDSPHLADEDLGSVGGLLGRW